MKKQMTLAEQVRDAQRVVNGWSTDKRESVRLEGMDMRRCRSIDKKNYTETLA